MGGHDHCAARECHDGRASRRGDVVNDVRLSFHVFPKDEESRRLWVSRVNRSDLQVKDVTRNTVLCSLHFHEGKRTFLQPHPVSFSHGKYPLCRPKLVRRSTSPPRAPSSKRRRTAETTVLVDATPVTPVEPEEVKVYQPLPLSSLASHALRDRLSSQERKIEQLNVEFAQLRIASSLASSSSSPVAKSPSTPPPSRPFLSWEVLSKSPEKFRYYSGLPTPGVFSAILEFCAEPLRSLIVRPGSSTGASGSGEKMGRPRSLSLENEFLLVLAWLRHGFKQEILADMFGLSGHSQVSYLINAWVPFLATELDGLLKWPTKEEVKANLPDSFKDDAECQHVRVILDCYEVWIEKPSSLSLNAAMYSDYKGHTTYKVLVGVTPTGYISFVSDAFPGAISDPAITHQSGLLDGMEEGDFIMADKGFTLTAADLQPRGIKLTLPPFREGDRQMPANLVVKNRKIANRRIVVENAIGRLRCWAILQHTMCLRAAQTGHVSDIVKLVAIFTNLGPPLRN